MSRIVHLIASDDSTIQTILLTGNATDVVRGDLTMAPTSVSTATAHKTIVQGLTKSTGVVLDSLVGTITLNNAQLAPGAIVTFPVANNLVTDTDVVCVQHDSGGTIGAYIIMPNSSALGSFKISVRNISAGNLSEAIVLRFVVIKSVAA